MRTVPINQFSSGLGHETMIAFASAGFTPADVADMLNNHKHLFPTLRELHMRRSEVKVIDHMIDIGGYPRQIGGFKVKRHTGSGTIPWNAQRTTLYTPRGAVPGRHESHYNLESIREQLRGKKVYGIALMVFLLTNKHLYPDEWWDTFVLFPDTEYTLGDQTFIYYLSSNATHGRIDCHYREVSKLTRDGRDRIALVK